ncbi:MAG: hypothetical protein GY719_35105 [bacterium]|nr:hypothetical protein [bacterium]
MARIASVQIAGYYPTPVELLPSFAALVRWREAECSWRRLSLLDPCAGDGEAIRILRNLWAESLGQEPSHLRIVANELEGERAARLAQNLSASDAKLHGDAFHLHWQRGEAAATALYLNPPYDTDPRHRRLEHRFLRRFTSALHPGTGVLFYLVPYHVLAVSAGFLSRHYLDLRAWRLPDPHFDAFAQVLLVARRAPRALPANSFEATVAGWGSEPEELPVLPEACAEPLEIDLDADCDYPLQLTPRGLDLSAALEAFRPWEDAPVGVDSGVRDLLGARFQTAMPPKPAHIALALSSGMFNGHRLEPNDATRHPPVLAKGIFERELVEVSERTNADGEVTGSVQVEQPRLRLWILRLDTYEYLELEPGVVPTGGDEPAQWNAADLIELYDRSLARLLARQFPPLHDPADPSGELALPALPRKPYRIQSQAIQAALKLIALGHNPFLLAEVGTGKSTMGLYVAAALSPAYRAKTVAELARLGFPTDVPTVRRTLVVCPPHLLKSWTDQTAAVMPGARVQVLRTISDLDTEADVYILSREAAKLGHRFEGISGACPRCGAPIGTAAETNASRRLRCQAQRRVAENSFAELVEMLAGVLAGVLPQEPLVEAHVSGPVLRRRLDQAPRPLRAQTLHPVYLRVLTELEAALSAGNGYVYALLSALETLATLLGAEEDTAEAVASAAEGASVHLAGYCRQTVERLRAEREPLQDPARALLGLLESFHADAEFSDGEPCGEPLFQAVARPRRFPLARRIQKRYRGKFDLIVADELHEYANTRSAQTHALHRLVGLPGVPTVALTGSLMGGYASSLFANFWALSRRFREEFGRDEKRAFMDRYGYRKVLVSRKDNEAPAAYGSTSDREIGRIQNLGEAPGVLPTFLMQHLLPVSIVVHKSDLDVELPPKEETPVAIEAGEDPRDCELLAECQRLQALLLERIRQDRFVKDRAGKLLGALLELPSYLDRCTEDCGEFRLAYPRSLGSAVIATARSFPSSYITPKERWLLSELKRLLAAGEKVLLFLRHTGTPALPRRLLRLIDHHVTTSCLWMDAQKVPAAKREAWIDRHVLHTGVQILLVNPDAVRTGLNNLVSFTAAIWHELHYSATTYRQANGRIHRIGQERPVSILFPYYSGTAQEVAFDLVARKVTASLQVDGLDIQAALEAAGASEASGTSMATAMALGEAVYRALTQKAA